MKREIMLIKRAGYCTLSAAYPSDMERLAKMKSDVAFRFLIADDRNVKHHRKLWAIFRAVVANDPLSALPDEKAVLTWVKYKAGYVRPIVVRGETIFEVDSISFSEMGQERFEKFYTQAVILCSGYLGVSVLELENNSSEYM